MAWTFYNASGEEMIIDGGVQASAAVFTGKVDLGSNLLVGNAGSTGIAISANGEVTMAAQPAFLAYNSASDTDVTGTDATTLDFDTEVFDQNADFASDTFTAPVTGRYLLTFRTRVYGVTAAADSINADIVTSNRTYRFRLDTLNDLRGNASYSHTAIADMDATDTATVTILIQGESGNPNDIVGDARPDTSFSGILLA